MNSGMHIIIRIPQRFRKLKTGQAVTFRTEEDEQGRGLAKEIYPADSKGDEELTDSEGMSEET